MKHTEQYLQTILTKMLRMNVLNSFNENNPLAQTKKNARTSHERIYKRGQKYAKAEDVFSHEDIVSGVISKAGNLLVCFEESRDKGIKVYPLILVMKLGVGNLIFGTQKLYHKTSIPMCIWAERNYWRIVVIFSYF